jgi:RimJ/RimL family protein N-acetyltransferase
VLSENARGATPTLPLVGPRILIRVLAEDDAPAVYTAIDESRAELRPWMPWAESHGTVEESLKFIRESRMAHQLGTDFPMGMFLQSDSTYLGGTGLHVRDPKIPSYEIGYWIRTSHSGMGYVSEAVRLLTACAFEGLSAQRVVIRCDARNERSKRVAERQHYVFEGRQRNAVRDTSGDLADMLIYAMVPLDYDRARRLWG